MECKLNATIRSGGAVSASLLPSAMIGARLDKGGSAAPYQGEYTVTPSEEIQTLETGGRVLLQNVTVEAIPSNYGRVTRAGANLLIC